MQINANMTAASTGLTLVLGATGKTGRRVAERAGSREMGRVGSRVDSDIGTEVLEDGAE